MAGTYQLGETKVRPGTYFRIQKKGEGNRGIMNGVTIVIFKADFGPLNTVVKLNPEDGYESIFGSGLTTDAVKEAFAGGAQTILACRLGSGGEAGRIVLRDTNGEDAVTITAKHPGEKEFTVTIRDRLADQKMKECIFYTGRKEFEKVTFVSGEGEAKALMEALAASRNFDVKIGAGKEAAELEHVLQSQFTKGSNPQVTVEDYSNALAEVEPYEANTICVDTEDCEVHMLLQSFVNRVFDAGSLMQAVVAEKHTVYLADRKAHAAAFNDEKMNYVLNAYVKEQGVEIDGYQTAARMAGMIGAAVSNSSLTHTVITGFTEILENLTNTEIISAEKKGCLVLSYNKDKQVWIDNAINTLVTLSDNQDAGWKKIRRVKTRFELMRRINYVSDSLVGRVDNDSNGRNTMISQLQAVGDSMKEEGKLMYCNVTESSEGKADGDSAWFDIDVIDKDSMEHIYLTFWFRFTTNVE